MAPVGFLRVRVREVGVHASATLELGVQVACVFKGYC